MTTKDITSTGFTLEWEKLNTVNNQSAKFYIVEVKCIQGNTLTVEILPGDSTRKVIKGLRPSTKYRVCVFGVNGNGQTFRSTESATLTNKGTRHWIYPPLKAARSFEILLIVPLLI